MTTPIRPPALPLLPSCIDPAKQRSDYVCCVACVGYLAQRSQSESATLGDDMILFALLLPPKVSKDEPEHRECSASLWIIGPYAILTYGEGFATQLLTFPEGLLGYDIVGLLLTGQSYVFDYGG